MTIILSVVRVFNDITNYIGKGNMNFTVTVTVQRHELFLTLFLRGKSQEANTTSKLYGTKHYHARLQ